jgi:hypothetical protein
MLPCGQLNRDVNLSAIVVCVVNLAVNRPLISLTNVQGSLSLSNSASTTVRAMIRITPPGRRYWSKWLHRDSIVVISVIEQL